MSSLQPMQDRPKGVVNPAAAEKMFRLERYLPEPDLAPYMEYFWLVAWALPDGATHVQRTLPSPCVHLVFDAGRTAVFGVMTGAFEYTLKGSGRVLGIRFRPGGFRALLRRPLHSITDQTVSLTELFNLDTAQAEQEVLSAPDDAGMVAAATGLLRKVLPDGEAVQTGTRYVAQVEAILKLIAEHPGLTQVQELADLSGMSVRRLQLLFKDAVGAGPKWVIRRNRLLDAADQLAKGTDVDLATLAQALGYYDQSHFTRDFEELVGKPPADYRRACATA
jgi:AraC-like DNA-binding protein